MHLQRVPDATGRLARATALVGALSLVAITAVAVSPTLRFTYAAVGAHVALEAVAALIATLATVLLAARLRRSRTLRDTVLTLGLGVLAASNVWFGLLPDLVDTQPNGPWLWAALLGPPIGLGLVALAAFTPERPVSVARALAVVRAGPVAAVAVVAAVLLLVDPALPTHADRNASSPRFDGPPGLVVTQFVTAALCMAAALGFARRARADRDELLGWLAMALLLGAFSRIGYGLYPPLSHEAVHTGDLFRLGCYAAILAGCLREIAGYQPRLVQAAVAEDRRRVARDLHDGMAQELAFIVGLVKTRADEDGWDDDLAAMRDAAQRALEESRGAIHALAGPGDEPLAVLLGDAAGLMAARAGMRLHLSVPGDLAAPGQAGEALLRITREAITNAALHGRARRVEVRAWRDAGGLHLRVRDDGRGFDPAGAGGGMGLLNMRSRTEALGGTLSVRSHPGDGTEVAVDLPQ